MASVFVKPITAHFAAVYGLRNGNPKKAALDAIFIIDAWLEVFSSGIADLRE